jgi:ABC-type multidrug transport system ATPase subunit
MFIYVNNKLLYSQSAQPAQSWQSGQASSASRNVPNHQVEHTTSNVLGANLYINIVRRTVRQGLFKELTLLKDINLTIQAGEMVLILGGSGAGKTTFMNAVMGYEKATGTIRHGDIDIYSQYNKMKYAIGFVPQDVLLRESDTVYDTLFNAATMKMPSGTTREMMAQRVETVMNMVSLSHVANSLIKSISGGEKKRVSAGVELVADPSLFFLDEPDSGLDAQSATELMENLRNIADAGKIVMIISHSPDRAAHLFNKVIVLAKSQVDNSGHLVFFGSVPDTEAFFGVNSLEGVVGKINRRDGQVEQYIARWKQISSNNNY